MYEKFLKALHEMLEDCPKCNGKGVKPKWESPPGYYNFQIMIPCYYCGKVRGELKKIEDKLKTVKKGLIY
jgi:hypothetical protein